jgi:predicted RNase H-like nuclease (RuvC/YqgF family)
MNYSDLFNTVNIQGKSAKQIELENIVYKLDFEYKNLTQQYNDIDNKLDNEDLTAKQFKDLRQAFKACKTELDNKKLELDNAKKELSTFKEQNPVRKVTTAEYCLAVILNENNCNYTSRELAVKAIALMPENERPITTNGVEMTARGVLTVFNYLSENN